MAKRALSGFTRTEYDLLMASGMFWEFYPEASGAYLKDCCQDEARKGEDSDQQSIRYALQF